MSRNNNRRPLRLETLESRWCPATLVTLPVARLEPSAVLALPHGDIAEPAVNSGTSFGGANGYVSNGPNPGWIEKSGGVVRVFGTTVNDTVTVNYSGAGTISVTLSNIHGVSNKLYATNTVTRVDVALYDGSDSFANSTYVASVVEAGSGNDTLLGGFGNDDLRGRTGADNIQGRSGNDKIYGGDQNDTLDGGGDNDTVAGNDGDDSLRGGDGNDLMSGGLGNDTLYGDDGDDDLFGDSGDDWLSGGDGDDEISGSHGADDLFGGEDDDELVGGTGDDYLHGGDGNDDLIGEDGADVMHGSDGNDFAHGGDGDDTITGGAGDDELFGFGDDDTITGGSGDDEIHGGDGDDDLDGGDDDDHLSGSTGDDLLRGGEGDDTLVGGSGDDTLYGGDGDDDLQGEAGLDGLFAGYGYDTVSGGADADRFLTLDVNGAALGWFDLDSDELTDVAAEDALIHFQSQDRVWTEGEVELVDGGLSRLHMLTGNTALLKDPQHPSDPMLFHRRAADENRPGNHGTNHGTSMSLYDVTFTQDADWLAFVTVHEIGHFWDSPEENEFVDEFREQSGWTTEYGAADPGDVQFVGDVFGEGGTYFVKAEDGDWWYEGGSLFVTDYAMGAPTEDFADTFTAFVLGDDFHRNGNDTPDAPVAKLAVIADWIASLS